jgi:hypothetical protein
LNDRWYQWINPALDPVLLHLVRLWQIQKDCHNSAFHFMHRFISKRYGQNVAIGIIFLQQE